MIDDLILDDDVSEALEQARRDLGLSQPYAIGAILRDWLESHGYLSADDLDEDSPVHGEA